MIENSFLKERFFVELESMISPNSIEEHEGYILIHPGTSFEMARILYVAKKYSVDLSFPWGKAPLRISPNSMNSILKVDRDSMTVSVQSGMRWEDLEHILREDGLTVGIIPLRRMTIMESLVTGMEPPGIPLDGRSGPLIGVGWALEGEVVQAPLVLQRSTGPQWSSALLGRGLNTAVPVEVRLRIWRQADVTAVCHTYPSAQMPGPFIKPGSRHASITLRQSAGVFQVIWLMTGRWVHDSLPEKCDWSEKIWSLPAVELSSGKRILHKDFWQGDNRVGMSRMFWNATPNSLFIPDENEGINEFFLRMNALHRVF